MLSQQDQEMRRNVPDPSFAGGSHFCESGAGNETTQGTAVLHNTNGSNLVLIWKPRTRDLNSSKNLTRKVFSLFLFRLIGVLAFFSLETTSKRQVTSHEGRNDAKQACFSLKTNLYALSAAKCVSLSLQVIAP